MKRRLNRCSLCGKIEEEHSLVTGSKFGVFGYCSDKCEEIHIDNMERSSNE